MLLKYYVLVYIVLIPITIYSQWVKINPGMQEIVASNIYSKDELWIADKSGDLFYLKPFEKKIEIIYSFPYSIKFIHFFNSLHGYVSIDYAVLETKNGGKSWDSVGSYASPLSVGNILTYLNEHIWFARSKFQGNDLLRTIDRGKSWNYAISGVVDGEIVGLSFVDDKNGWFASNQKWTYSQNGTLFKTENSGLTWTKKYVGNPNNSIGEFITSFFALDENICWLSTSKGTMITKNSGVTWEKISTLIFWKFFFIDDLNGWAFNIQKLYKTNDGGRNWNI